MVLLANDGLLPLKKTIGTLAVIGPNADAWRNLLGDYSYAAQLEYALSIVPPDSPLAGLIRLRWLRRPPGFPTILEAIRLRLPAAKYPVCARL